MEFICGAIYRVRNEENSFGMMLATEERQGVSHGLFQRFGHAPMRINNEYNGGMELELVSVPGGQVSTKKKPGPKKRLALEK
ncbi:MAG TPA: hypothetical protein EYN27_08365 [Rhodospirillales bacterium]|nr:hypothetical protein [Rhodospirillales bacterium]